jgi:hypothetical protein
MAPNGPKTPCLGCAVHHKINHTDLPLNDHHVGALFQGSSPVQTDEEVKIALGYLNGKPAVGNVTRNGFENNSDYPESDSDDEGNIIVMIPQDYAFAKANTGKDKKFTYKDRDGTSYQIAANKKGYEAEEELYRQKALEEEPSKRVRKLRAREITRRKTARASQLEKLTPFKKTIADINESKTKRKENNKKRASKKRAEKVDQARGIKKKKDR